MSRYFIHKGKVEQIESVALAGGGYVKAEIMCVMKDVERMVPRWDEEKDEWAEIKFKHSGNK